MTLLNHFEENIGKYIILTLNDADWDEFIAKLPSPYKSCYIPEKELQHRITTFSSTKEKELSEILPSNGNIKSGDFGEILSYFIFKERHINQNVDGPKKWRWKQEKNVAAPYTDVLLFSIKNQITPSKEDLLISVESKMKATVNNGYHPIQNAIDGAEKDYVTRIANSLSWLRKKYKDESLKENAPIQELKGLVTTLERFIHSETVGEYTKQLKAIAFVDKTFLQDEIKKIVTMPSVDGTSFEVFVVSIKDLKKVYETVFTEIPKL